jgi:putative transcriptional regulator
MSDAELGRRLGISRQAVNAIVNGRSDPTLIRLHEIAAMLDVKVRDLFME